jgi:IS30 family transposase
MTKTYNQLNLEQRYKIETLKSIGKTYTEIANIIGVHKSTISREIRRNVPQRGRGAKVYEANRAEYKTMLRHKLKPKQIKFTPALKLETKTMMKEDRFSPELVAAEWRKNGVIGVSYETIYKFIWTCKHSNKRKNTLFKNLYKSLRHGKRKRKRGNYRDSRGLIPNRVSIEKRPSIVEKRKRFGDIEADLIMGKAHQSALLVTVDRFTLKTTIDKLKGKDAKQVERTLLKRLQQMPPIKTITFDNDQAFRFHESIGRKLNAKTYFTRPYTSQDKGTIENRNGLIRMFFPKQTDFNNVSKAEIREVEKKINNRPVRKFNYLTPNEVFLKNKR